MITFRQTSFVTSILIVSALAWTALLGMTQTMASTSPFLAFMSIWVIMMAAMMLPTLAPLVSRYARMIEAYRWLGMVQILSGYLGVWALAGIVAYGMTQLVTAVARSQPDLLTPLAMLIYAVGGVYQFTSLKDRCLATCRTPLAQLLEYASWKGHLRHVRVGFHHGVFCTGCCWSLMLLLFAFGWMNIILMVIVAAVVAVEKLWTRGRWFSYAVGGACLVMAVGVLWFPQLAPGLMAPTAVMPMP